ncbi:hypothetical protein NIES2107_56080 [Nostoc carneum NIES-2107]|nr:hypothetical protein NIES2107_56080 [Nostoc carneum NIES-2107]
MIAAIVPAIVAIITAIATALGIPWWVAASLVAIGVIAIVSLAIILFNKLLEIIRNAWKKYKDIKYSRIIRDNPIQDDEIVHIIHMSAEGEIISGTTVRGRQVDEKMKELQKNTIVNKEE